MRALLIGGPFDGALGTREDPQVPAVWPCWGGDGCVWFRAYPVDGRPRYNRADGGRYIFDGITEQQPLDAMRVGV